MKRFFILFLMFALLLCVGCSSKEAETTQNTELSAPAQLPRGLVGQWVSATVSDRGYSEIITFEEDGYLTVSSMKDGVVEQTIYGSFRIEGRKLIFDITGGAAPYSDEFEFTIDGRELYLTDSDGLAHYLRTS